MKRPKYEQPADRVVLGLISGLLVIYIAIRWQNFHSHHILLFASGLIGLVSSLYPKGGKIIADIWMWLGHLLGKVVGSILLSLVYIMILTPLAQLRMVFKRKNIENQSSNWLNREYDFEKKDFKDLW